MNGHECIVVCSYVWNVWLTKEAGYSNESTSQRQTQKDKTIGHISHSSEHCGILLHLADALLPVAYLSKCDWFLRQQYPATTSAPELGDRSSTGE